MGRIISIVKQKEGVGKTTTTINLAASLAVMGKKVLIVDVDPQANASSGLGIDIRKVKNTVYECLVGKISAKDAIMKTEIDSLHIIPSHIDLVGVEVEFVREENTIKEPNKVLKKLLAEVKDDYDYILLDCLPSLGIITVNALTASDSVIIPVQCEYFALEGIGQLLNTIKIIKTSLNTALEIDGFLLTMYDGRLRLANQVYEEVKKHFKDLVFDTVIQRNTRLSEAPSHGKPVVVYDPESKGALNYMQLAKELVVRTDNKKKN